MQRALLAVTWLVLVMIINGDFVDVAQVTSKNSAFNEFRTYAVVVPIVQDGGKRISSTRLVKSGHVPEIAIELSAFSKKLILKLHLNEHLFGSNYTETSSYDPENNNNQLVSENCYYTGYVVGDETGSIAAVSTCAGLRGFITTADEDYHMEPVQNSLTGRHYIYRDSDYIGNNYTCASGTEFSDLKTSTQRKLKRSLRQPRNGGTKPSIRWPYDANDKTMLVELYIANDFSQLYRPLNIYVALVGVEVWVDGDRIEIVDNADKTMNNFLEYRRNYICPKHRNDNAQLITGRTLGDGVVGKAPIMTICTWQYSGGVNLDHSALVGPVATTVAHEMGHNFGLTHDNEECACPDDRCIMASSSGGIKNPTKWSDCSKQQFADSFHLGMDYCLHDLPDQIHDGPVCGNGFTEAGEQCDCGLKQDCHNSCCNSTTCKLQPNASCAMGECCDQSSCQLKSAATLCRAVDGECDLGEYCDGVSEFCPSNAYRPDGTDCYTDSRVTSFCYGGKCNSHDEQCKLLWGMSGETSHPQCYKNFNVMGTVNGHCGFSWVDNKSFKKCEDSDVMCGMLHCNHRHEKLMFWKEALAYNLPEAWVLVNGTRHECKGVILDVGLDMPDPGMVPNGAKCGNGKMCVGQRCTDVASLGTMSCPDCHSHGICNNLQQCHCDPGYAPPFCDIPGGGGSLHSGPMTVSHHNVGLAVGMCFLGFFLLVLLGLLVVCAYRHNEQLKQFWQERDKYRSVRKDVPRNDSERPPLPPPPAGRSPNKLTNGFVHEDSVIYRPNSRLAPVHDRPRSVATSHAPRSDSAPRTGSASVKRASSVRGAEISNPCLQSSTNQSIIPLRPAPARPYGDDEIQLMPTRTAPPIPRTEPLSRNLKPADDHQIRKAPSRPPIPASSAIRKELGRGDEIAKRSPSGPPPAPPDSRYRFYSPSVPVREQNALENQSHQNGHLGQQTVVLSRSPRHLEKSISSSSSASGLKKQNPNSVQTPNAGSSIASNVNSPSNSERQTGLALPSKSVPSVEKRRPKPYTCRPGVNESQC